MEREKIKRLPGRPTNGRPAAIFARNLYVNSATATVRRWYTGAAATNARRRFKCGKPNCRFCFTFVFFAEAKGRRVYNFGRMLLLT